VGTFPQPFNATEWLNATLQQGVVFVPGEYFFSDNPDRSTFRLSFATATEPADAGSCGASAPFAVILAAAEPMPAADIKPPSSLHLAVMWLSYNGYFSVIRAWACYPPSSFEPQRCWLPDCPPVT
jgi:hypothetical protein